MQLQIVDFKSKSIKQTFLNLIPPWVCLHSSAKTVGLHKDILCLTKGPFYDRGLTN
jgi:hypothetical protein